MSLVKHYYWGRFRRNRPGCWSLWLFILIVVLLAGAPFIANDRPLLVLYDGKLFLPVLVDYPETDFGGDFNFTNYSDPELRRMIAEKSGLTIWPLIRFSYKTYHAVLPTPAPSPPTWMLRDDVCSAFAQRQGLKTCRDLDQDWLGTDDAGRDVLARVIYGVGFATAIGLAIAAIGLALGILAGAAAGRGIPQAAAASMRAVPFLFCCSIGLLLVLDMVGLGVPPGWPSLGEVIGQARGNVQAPWIAVGAIVGVGVTGLLVMLVTLIARAARNALAVKPSVSVK
jgi:ABC-type microcin C transport system permease subunit YejE